MDNPNFDHITDDGNYEEIGTIPADKDNHIYVIPSKPQPPETTQSPTQSPAKPNGYKTVAIVSLVLLVLMSGAVGYLAWRVIVYKPSIPDLSPTCHIDCKAHQISGSTESGVYCITIGSAGITPREVNVFCDMVTDGGGWTVLLKRQDGSVTFDNYTWSGYRAGFGEISGEYYIGNENLHDLTMNNGVVYEVRIDLQSDTGDHEYAVYDKFLIDNETNKYRLTLGAHSGPLENSLYWNSGQFFSTVDQDNDAHTVHCAQVNTGGWWFNQCTYCKLLSGYGPNGTQYNRIGWNGFTNNYIKYADMKLRPQ